MKYIYTCIFCLLVSSVTAQKIEHHFAIGAQMPASRFLDPTTGNNLIPVAFPLTFRYGVRFAESHAIGLTLGGRGTRELTFAGVNGPETSGPIRTYNARIGYRWYINPLDYRWQPFIGGGVLLGFLDAQLPTGRANNLGYSLFAQAGLRVSLGERLFLETEIPVPINLGLFGVIPQIQQAGIRPEDFIRGFWNIQRNQPWPVLSVGLKL